MNYWRVSLSLSSNYVIHVTLNTRFCLLKSKIQQIVGEKTEWNTPQFLGDMLPLAFKLLMNLQSKAEQPLNYCVDDFS